MPIDINLFRKERGGDPEKIRESCKKRFQDPKIVDEIMELDEHYRKLLHNVESHRRDYNIFNKEVAAKKKASKGKDPCTEEIEKVKQAEAKIKEAEVTEKDVYKQLLTKISKIGNIVDDKVPVHQDEEHNRVERTWGEIPKNVINSTKGHCHHHEILAMIDGYDPKRGVKIAGHRGFFLRGPGVLLNMALQNYGVQFLVQKGYTPMYPPFFMKRSVMAETAQLSDFDEALYKVTGNPGDDDFYLIATSEQPISGYLRGEIAEPDQLPMKFAGVSSCFRKEAGAHGKDTWGIFRIHQFEKVEQFCITTPEKSREMHEDMIRTSEEFMKSLELPYQVINIVSGALNDAATIKYDLEAWFPGYNAYRELVSCSNCTDFQSRGLEIRCGSKKTKDEERKFVHMLNGTLCATQRTLCCILENYQTETGVRVPKVLQPLMGGLEFIPYVKDVPKKVDLGQE